ncbi:MAG: indolepyruvate oxidoreductase subunit beta [Candidatus Hadarchaeum sp.]|uniref:indolepyruvate oxidoreductase subunit beta n=1 Tax=Candidatus Hadarchaeum sp. TaxID=2883567 RepID=UPI0031779C17
MKNLNLIIAGVGGQGSVLASHMVAMAAIRDGLRARVGETFGAAMRGGAVASHVRIGEDVNAPLVPRGGAEIVLAMEPLEGLRNVVDFMAKGGLLLTNTHEWLPVNVNIGRAKYPNMEQIRDAVAKLGGKIIEIDGTSLAQQAGNVRTLNVVMLGALAATGKLPFSTETLRQVITENVPRKTVDMNLKAFDLGLKSI